MEIYKPQVFDFESSKIMFDQLAGYIQDRIVDINGDQGIVRLAFSGGQSTVPLFERFKKQLALPWERVEFYQTDERYVPRDNPDSNQRLMLETLGDDFCLDIGELNLIKTDLPLDQATKDYSDKLDNLDGKLFDMLVLGVGPDGHIASLFPFGEYLKHQEQSVIATTSPQDFAVASRISLTIESILNSEEIILIIYGSQKENILTEMLDGSKRATEFPAKFLLAHPSLKIYHSIEE